MKKEIVSIDDYEQIKLPELPFVPGMISEYECKYLYWLTSEKYTGQGAVVEVGTWLGRSSIHLGAGLRDSGKGGTLHCYDLFVWNKYFNAPHLKANLPLQHGDDFQPYFEKNVRQVYSDIKVNKGPLQHVTWNEGPIEILFIDAPKSLDTIIPTLKAFGPHLIPGKSIIVMQDFLHAPSYPLALVFSMLRKETSYLHAVPYSSTCSFSVEKSIKIKNQKKFNFFKWNQPTITDAWEYILSQLPVQPREYLEPGLGMSLIDAGYYEKAIEVSRTLNLSKDGYSRLEFLSKLPQYYSKYHAIFDTSISNYHNRETYQETLSTDPTKYTVENGTLQNINGQLVLEGKAGAVACVNTKHKYKHYAVFRFTTSSDISLKCRNAFLVFGENNDYRNRISVGLYLSKNECWIEEHPNNYFKMKNVRKTSKYPIKENYDIEVTINLTAKVVVISICDDIFHVTFEGDLSNVAWAGFRIYNTNSSFSPISISGN